MASVINVTQISAGKTFSTLMNTCPTGFTGPTCSDFICEGIPSTSKSVCSGLGSCVGTNLCVCDPPSFGPNCQRKEYHWSGNTGSWSNLAYWGVKRNDLINPAITLPSNGDTVYFDLPGTFTVVVDVPNVSLKSLIIGNDVSMATLQVSGSNIVVDDAIYLHKSSSMTAISSVISFSTLQVNGTITMDGSQSKLSGSSFSVFGTLNLTNGRLENFKTMDIYGTLNFGTTTGEISLPNTKIVIHPDATWNHWANAILGSASCSISNFGSFSISAGVIRANLVNYANFLVVQGNGSITWLGGFQTQTSRSSITLKNGDFTIFPALNITSGNMIASGNLRTQNFIFDSQDGSFSMTIPNKLRIVGNVTFTERSTVFFTLNGTNYGESDVLIVTDLLKIDSLVLLKLGNGYSPIVPDQIPFLTLESTEAAIDPSSFKNINLFGAPYKGAEFISSGNSGSFRITLSVGSVQVQGYKCHYLGNQKIIEMNRFDKANKIVLSLTTPRRDNVWMGFGFDLNGTSPEIVSAIALESLVQEVSGHNRSLQGANFAYMDSTVSQTIFRIGPTYRTITVLLSLDLLKNQQNLYYVQLENVANVTIFNSSRDYTESFKFSILNDPKVDCTNFLQPLRAEIYHIGAYIPVLIIYAVLLVLCIVFYRFRPLVTRGISPILTILFLTLQLLLEFKNLSEISSFQGSLCFYYTFGVYPLQQICFIMILLYFIRYFAIINLNENKKTIYNKIKVGKNIEIVQRVKLRILKMLTSTPLTIGVLIGSYLLIIFIFFIVIAADNFVCLFRTLIALRTINNVELIIIYLLTILTLVVDVIPNYELILKFKWREYIFYGDPYWFRVQIILFLPFMIFTVAVEIFQFFTNLDYLGIAQNFWASIGLNTAICAILLLIDVIFPLLITIITLLLASRHPARKSKLTIAEVVLNPETSQIFFEFCQYEFSLENLLAYRDIQDYKKVPTKEGAEKIYDEYLKGATSVMEVNVPQRLCIAVKERIDANDFNMTIFDKIESDLNMNLADTFSRFVLSKDYLKLLQTKKIEKELIEGK